MQNSGNLTFPKIPKGIKFKVNGMGELRRINVGDLGYITDVNQIMAQPVKIKDLFKKRNVHIPNLGAMRPTDSVWIFNPLPVKNIEEKLGSEMSSNRITVTNVSGECKICSEIDVKCLLEPCGHYIACADCSTRLKKCSTCQAHIKRRVHPDGRTLEFIPKADRPTNQTINYLQNELQHYKDLITCNICYVNLINTAFDCGHSGCNNCLNGLRNCHICRKPITKTILLFLN